jgi:hypothetical protein
MGHILPQLFVLLAQQSMLIAQLAAIPQVCLPVIPALPTSISMAMLVLHAFRIAAFVLMGQLALLANQAIIILAVLVLLAVQLQASLRAAALVLPSHAQMNTI